MTMKREMIWTAILGLVAVIGSYGLACVFPFAAVAALAAVTLDTRRGALLVGTTFLANQIVGFTLMNYPLDTQAFAWSGFIAAGALGAFAAARLVQRGATLLSVRTLFSLAASILAYQVVMFTGALALDGFASSTPEIVAAVALSDIYWFAGLAALHMIVAYAFNRGGAALLPTT
jgi:hypothetical protein